MNDTKQKGLVTELQCETYFVKLGYTVLTPLGEDSRYDFVIDVDGKFLRIQVKTCKVLDDKFSFYATSTRVNSKGVIKKFYDKTQIDYFATFCNEVCYLIPVEMCKVMRTFTMDEEKSKTAGRLFAGDFIGEKVLENFKNGIEYREKKTEIRQYSLDGVLINTYPSIREAARQIGGESKDGKISEVCNGKRKTAYGFVWERVEL